MMNDKKTVLVADDERRWREHVKTVLGDQYNVESVTDCESVLPRIEQGGVDLLVLDHLMPGTEPLSTGFDLCTHLRAHRPALPIVLYSGAWIGVPVPRQALEGKMKATVVFKDVRDAELDNLRTRVDGLLCGT